MYSCHSINLYILYDYIEKPICLYVQRKFKLWIFANSSKLCINIHNRITHKHHHHTLFRIIIITIYIINFIIASWSFSYNSNYIGLKCIFLLFCMMYCVKSYQTNYGMVFANIGENVLYLTLIQTKCTSNVFATSCYIYKIMMRVVLWEALHWKANHYINEWQLPHYTQFHLDLNKMRFIICIWEIKGLQVVFAAIHNMRTLGLIIIMKFN